jgi:GH18 family chitinase
MLTVGGYGYGPGYAAATAPAVRPTLEANMIAYMQANGYDGIDLDWEDAMVPSQYLALAQELRAKFDTMSPKPLFSMATACWIGVDPNMFQYFDFMNVMSYTEPVSGLGPDFSCYSGVPASKLGVGMGLGDSGGVDTTPAAVKAKCDYAVANGYGGVMQWLLEDDYTANGPSLPLMAVIAPYVPVP